MAQGTTHPNTAARQQRLALAIALSVSVLAAVNWALHPEEARRWFRAMLILPALWAGLTLWYHGTLRSLARRGVYDQSGARSYYTSAITLAFVAFGIPQIVRYGLRIWVELLGSGADLDTERRILGLAGSATIIIVGNTLPKILTPFSMLPPGAASRQSAARRFIGLIWVMLGLTMALGFLLAPLTFAATLARWTFAGGMVAMLAAIIWMNTGPLAREG
jgi:hypothetical protein